MKITEEINLAKKKTILSIFFFFFNERVELFHVNFRLNSLILSLAVKSFHVS